MPRNDEGEFEMMLGNRQLLSIFFIVVILLAVFFTMGYLMGRGSGTSGGPILAKSTASDGAPKPEATPPGSEVAATPPAPQGEQHPAELAPGQAVVSTTPAPGANPPPAAPAEPVAKPADAKPAEPPAATPAPANFGPQPGETYLQVAATSRAEAELTADVLKKRGFSALIAPVPNSPAFRVLVGPVKDSAQISRSKLDLDALGFKTVLVRKY